MTAAGADGAFPHCQRSIILMDAMTLLDAQEFDESRERRRRTKIIGAIVVVVLTAVLVYMNRYLPEKRIAKKFFAALQNKQYETAYGLYYADPQWKEHPQKYSKYPFNEFYQDWGPGGPWGLIKNYDVNGAAPCPGRGSGSGIVVDVVVNERAEHAQLWVEKSDKTLSTPPCDLQFQ